MQETITPIALDDLHESPFNPRKTFTDIAELTQLLLDCAIVDGVKVEYHNVEGVKAGPLFALADHYGIDVRDVLARFRGARSMAKAAADAAGTSTPSTAGAGAKKATAARAKTPALGKGIRYRCAATGSTWSGKGPQPKWLKVALAQGKTLADFDLAAQPKAQDQEVKVDAGCARAHYTHTGDLLEAAGA